MRKKSRLCVTTTTTTTENIFPNEPEFQPKGDGHRCACHAHFCPSRIKWPKMNGEICFVLKRNWFKKKKRIRKFIHLCDTIANDYTSLFFVRMLKYFNSHHHFNYNIKCVPANQTIWAIVDEQSGAEIEYRWSFRIRFIYLMMTRVTMVV